MQKTLQTFIWFVEPEFRPSVVEVQTTGTEAETVSVLIGYLQPEKEAKIFDRLFYYIPLETKKKVLPVTEEMRNARYLVLHTQDDKRFAFSAVGTPQEYTVEELQAMGYNAGKHGIRYLGFELIPEPTPPFDINAIQLREGDERRAPDFKEIEINGKSHQPFHPITNPTISFIDLFAGIGGIRKGLENACTAAGFATKCVFTSEIKPHAIKILQQNHPDERIYGDITQIQAKDIPDFDILLAGFPCQAFSSAGKRLGFEDTRGTLFFDVARILKEKRPQAFILENVEGLVNHDKQHPKDEIGNTLQTILATLDEIGYKVSWRVLNAKDFGIPQERKRIYIVGTRYQVPNLEHFTPITRVLGDFLQQGEKTDTSPFTTALLEHFKVEELIGKSLKDKRGGEDNIHSWDIELKGTVSSEQKELLDLMLKERRKKKWAEEFGIKWMDGMPLTKEQIESFYHNDNLDEMLFDLVEKGYLKLEHPKQLVGKKRIQDRNLPLGYNIVAGKMSFKINKVLDPNSYAPTLVAMDMERIYVPDGDGIRPLTLREGMRLFGYEDNYKFDIENQLGYDLLGNTVVVPVIQAVANRTLEILIKNL